MFGYEESEEMRIVLMTVLAAFMFSGCPRSDSKATDSLQNKPATEDTKTSSVGD